MASRLSRWAVITVVALAMIAAVLLPPGEAREPDYDTVPDAPTNALDGAILANRAAVSATEGRLAGLRRSRALARYRADPSPLLVLQALRDGFMVDTVRTRAAQTLWRTLPPGGQAPRTLLIQSGDRQRNLRMAADRCEAQLPTWEHVFSQGTVLYAGAGGCFLQAWFGLPGTGLRSWIDSMGGIEVPRPRTADRTEIREVALATDVWVRVLLGRGETFAWWGSPELEACAAGRSSFCSAALRFTPTQDTSRRGWSVGWYREQLLAGVPAALLRDLGPERFATLWRSDRPVPETYQTLTGGPFDEWAERYVQRRVGRVVRHTALSFEGWLGWGLWMGLLGAAMAVRLRGQGVAA